MTLLSLRKLILRSLQYFSRNHAAVGLGIAAATAVIVGALVVGDSVRGSLRGLVTDRLANIQCLLQARTFFEPELVDISLPEADAAEAQATTVPLILLAGSSVERRAAEDRLWRATGVQILATGKEFWEALTPRPAADLPEGLQEDEIALNASLARELSASLGDEITLRFQPQGGVPADNPLGRREDTSLNLPRQRIVAILPDEGVGGISFMSTQSVPHNVFCSLAAMQDALQCDRRVNAALVLESNSSTATPNADLSLRWSARLTEQLRPRIEDYGLQFERIRRVFPQPGVDRPQAVAEDSTQTIYDYFQLSSRDLIIDEDTAQAVDASFARQATRLITYLANTVVKVESPPVRRGRMDVSAEDSVFAERANPDRPEVTGPLLSRPVPYSTILGVDSDSALALSQHTSLEYQEVRSPFCWINTWLAEQLSAGPGDWLRITYFAPETINGSEVEQDLRVLVAGVVPLTEPLQGFRRNRPASYGQAPTVFNDPDLTPHVPGLTDKDSMANWDAPFKLDHELILPADDAYYANHRLTPKIFMPYRYASSTLFFGSRFGRTTAIRFPLAKFPDEQSVRTKIEDALLATRPQKGLTFLPVRAHALQAASGTTPFDMLFLSLSFFVIVAALLLVTLLFKLGIGQRAGQLGILAAQGYPAARIRRLLLCELSVVAVGGAGLGILLGLLYARLMIAGLESWWVGAISTPFLHFSFTGRSLLIGAVAGVLTSLLTIYAVLRRLSRLAPLTLLRGHSDVPGGPSGRAHRLGLSCAGFAVLAAIGLIVAAIGQTGMARAGSFFGSGMLLLLAALLAIGQWISRGRPLAAQASHHGNLGTLAWRAISRNPTRSTLSLGLLSVASFLIASMSVFHVSPNPRGYGGFDLLGESSQPIYRNIGSDAVRREMIGEQADELAETTIVPLRARPGEDASCNNLFQVAEPMVLGVPPRLGELHSLAPAAVEFEWAATAAPQNPWAALEEVGTGSTNSPIPVILDQNTAAWSLKQGASLGALITLEYDGRTVTFQTVGLLSNSVLQGKLLIGQENFQLLFPQLSGYRYFLIRSGGQSEPSEVAAVLEKGWSNEGLDVTTSQEVLQRLLGVQNTYISAFQSLGALGLLLGAFGLVAVQLRSVLERRRELALMQAVGFSRGRIGRMLTLETALLLGGGLLVGVAAAAVALVPYVLETGPQLSTAQPLLMLGLVLLAGFAAASLAVRSALKQSVLSGLRSE